MSWGTKIGAQEDESGRSVVYESTQLMGSAPWLCDGWDGYKIQIDKRLQKQFLADAACENLHCDMRSIMIDGL